ncbi:DUF3857 domain-containing protein [Lewinella sp. IMCC34183]|uniref:DUF3857 domain-containing protein n=1 Tax=Lewinella sp. IMCC34183 TaxID=2248762 RepID=UPI000E23D347|nr:DUF3857 domain-containing protein [Lewinella sp. IMCC34183]
MVLRVLGPLLFVLFTTGLLAQDYSDVRFGKLSDSDLAALPPAPDSAASAYVLYDHLDLKFDYLSGQGPVLQEYVHTRVKLLTPASFDRANVTLRYNPSYQDISGIKAVIHLPDGERIKLSGRAIVRERDGDYRTIKFAFPQVTAGAVIEYTYKRRSDNILIPTPYAFQRDVPVRWAEYSALIPDYYRYVSLGTSGEYAIDEVKQSRMRWGPVFAKAPTAHESVSHNDIRWAMRDVAAFERQPYTNNATDYLPRVRLQLQSVNYPGEIVEPIFHNWEETVKELHQRRDFGGAYTNRSNYNQLWKAAEPVIMAEPDYKSRIDAAYTFVCRNLRWNGSTSIFGSESPNKVFTAGEGNSADLNLALLALLKEAGIPARPLLVSLRDGGTPIEVYPILTQFDHLLVYTELDGKPYLLDANGPGRAAGLPRLEALNHRGWVADPYAPRWVDVEVPRARQVVMANINFNAEGEPLVDLQSRLNSYFALQGRYALARTETPLDWPVVQDIAATFPATRVIAELGHEGENDTAGPLSLHVKLRVPASVVADEYIYLQPVILPVLDDELDDVEQRLYPVDFPYPWQLHYVANVQAPEGYAVDELPESIRLVSEDRGMTATYTAVERASGTVSITLQVQLDRTVYPATAYPTLRHMYRRIIEMQEANIVYRRAK